MKTTQNPQVREEKRRPRARSVGDARARRVRVFGVEGDGEAGRAAVGDDRDDCRKGGNEDRGDAKPIVMTSMTAKFGTVLVDPKGMTLYTLTNGATQVACTGQCATFWPPLFLAAGGDEAAARRAGVTGLGTMMAAGGTQVTENGVALYRFSKDNAPGDTNGDGISSFGGVWHVATPGLKLAASRRRPVRPPRRTPSRRS